MRCKSEEVQSFGVLGGGGGGGATAFKSSALTARQVARFLYVVVLRSGILAQEQRVNDATHEFEAAPGRMHC